MERQADFKVVMTKKELFPEYELDYLFASDKGV